MWSWRAVVGPAILAQRQEFVPDRPLHRLLAAQSTRMEVTMGPGGHAAMRGHGGMTARVIAAGAISVGDKVSAEP